MPDSEEVKPLLMLNSHSALALTPESRKYPESLLKKACYTSGPTSDLAKPGNCDKACRNQDGLLTTTCVWVTPSNDTVYLISQTSLRISSQQTHDKCDMRTSKGYIAPKDDTLPCAVYATAAPLVQYTSYAKSTKQNNPSHMLNVTRCAAIGAMMGNALHYAYCYPFVVL